MEQRNENTIETIKKTSNVAIVKKRFGFSAPES